MIAYGWAVTAFHWHILALFGTIWRVPVCWQFQKHLHLTALFSPTGTPALLLENPLLFAVVDPPVPAESNIFCDDDIVYIVSCWNLLLHYVALVHAESDGEDWTAAKQSKQANRKKYIVTIISSLYNSMVLAIWYWQKSGPRDFGAFSWCLAETEATKCRKCPGPAPMPSLQLREEGEKW